MGGVWLPWCKGLIEKVDICIKFSFDYALILKSKDTNFFYIFDIRVKKTINLMCLRQKNKSIDTLPFQAI